MIFDKLQQCFFLTLFYVYCLSFIRKPPQLSVSDINLCYVGFDYLLTGKVLINVCACLCINNYGKV